MEKRKLLMDSVAMAQKTDAMAEAVAATQNGVVLVATEASFMDAAWVRKNLNLVEEMLKTGKMVLHFFNTPDLMVQKTFTWSSFGGLTTEAAENFEAVCEQLPEDNDLLMAVYNVAMQYGQPRGTWEMGDFIKVQALNEEDAQLLGVPMDASRTLVLAACQEKGVGFAPYNERYLAGMISQHLCDGLF